MGTSTEGARGGARVTSRGSSWWSRNGTPQNLRVAGLSFAAALVLAGAVYLGLRGGSAPSSRSELPMLLPPMPVQIRGLPGKIDYGPGARVDEKYDRFNDLTTFQSSAAALAGESRSARDAELSAYWFTVGKVADFAPDSIRVEFYRSGETWRYLDFHPVVLLIDGVRFAPDKTERTGSVHSGSVSEWIRWEMPTQDFVTMVTADRIEMKVGIDEFETGRMQMAPLRALAATLPSAMRPK